MPERLAVDKPGHPVAFFAFDRTAPGTVPLYQGANGGLTFSNVSSEPKAIPLFYALPSTVEKPPVTTLPLYEFAHEDGKRRVYSVDPKWSGLGFQRGTKPICFVWEKPMQ